MPRSKNTFNLGELTPDDIAPLVGAEGPTLRSALQAITTWATSRDFREQLMQACDFPIQDDLGAFLVVNQLIYRGVARPTDLANAIDTSRSNLSKIVSRLEAADLVFRATDPRDDRGVVIGLTSRGREVGRRVLAASGDEMSLPSWTTEEIQILERLIIKLAKSIDALEGHPLANIAGVAMPENEPERQHTASLS